MQFTFFCLFTIIFGYSLVISAPVNKNVPDSQETKQQKATAIASRLLKELAGEQIVSHNQESSSSNKDESKDTIIPINQAGVEKVESHIENQKNDDINDDDDDSEDIDFAPTLEDLYEIYGDKYARSANDEESSSESSDDDEYILPISQQQLLNYLAEQDESDEHLVPVIHTPVMDDSIMTAEDHRRRRRSIY